MDTIKINSKKTKMVAHRGVSWLEKENTCPAFVAAANRSYFGIETDIHVTKDGKFVVIHDETTKRITNDAVEINVEENDYDAVKDILLPDFGASLPRSDIRIPLLADYIAICKKYDKTCVLEIKNPFKEEDLVRMIEEIKTLDYLDKMIFISFAFENCTTLRKLLPQAQIQFLTSKRDVDDELIKLLVDNKLDLDIHYKKLTKKNVKKLHDNGIVVNCWTVNEKEEAEALVKMKVDYITSNILE